MEVAYNSIYEKLVISDDDLVGLIAYGLYKRHKIEFITSIRDNEGRVPTQEECHSFFVSSTTDSQLNKYRDQAETLLYSMVVNVAGEDLDKRENDMLKDYQNNIKAVLPSNKKTIALSVISSLIFSFILAIFFILGQTSERSTNASVSKMIQNVKPANKDSAATYNFHNSGK